MKQGGGTGRYLLGWTAVRCCFSFFFPLFLSFSLFPFFSSFLFPSLSLLFSPFLTFPSFFISFLFGLGSLSMGRPSILSW